MTDKIIQTFLVELTGVNNSVDCARKSSFNLSLHMPVYTDG